MSTTFSDTSTWLPLDGLAPGFDANKAPASSELAGRTVTLRNDGGATVSHEFGATRVDWAYTAVEGDPHGDAEGADTYEAFQVDDDLYFVQFHVQSRPEDAVSLVIDLRSGRSLTIGSTIADPEPGRTRVRHTFETGSIDGITPSGAAAHPSTSLVGRRVFWEYSEEHAYEHVYLSPQWYSWQCLAGPERGLADTDENSVWEVRPGIFVFAWREKVIPCASVTIADHRDVSRIRSHGVLFGLDETGEVPTHFTFGAYGRLISVSVHPDGFDPSV